MKSIILLFLIISSLLAKQYTNELIREHSPYLLQHAHNPVHWMAYNEKAFLKAKREHKPIFLSIGYSTCHWCHVMEKESFTDEKLAYLFNKYFVCIKVDREEMPQIDTYYQELYLHVKDHSGGWPLNVMLSEDQKPFYMATYISSKTVENREGFDTLLQKYGKLYQKNRAEIEKISSLMLTKQEQEVKKTFKISIRTLADSINANFDDLGFGFSIAPKFPEASKLQLLFTLASLKEKGLDEKGYEMLDMMALHGLYDQVEGGFFRYSTDASWEIPHFEKMLYNQAELIPLYTDAYQKTGKKLYIDIVEETIAFVQKRFQSDGVFWSASDADSKMGEGGYFTFSKCEIDNALKNNPHKVEIKKSLGNSLQGNFEGKVHLNFYAQERPKGFELFRKELQKIRETREYPFRDKKINTAWNAMMIEAYYKASVLNEKYSKEGDYHLQKLLLSIYIKGKLYHQKIEKNTPTKDALLEDYSFLISALIEGYEVSYDEKKLKLATKLSNEAIAKFYKNGTWFLSDKDLHVRADMKDKYYTSALAKMTQNLLKLSILNESLEDKKIADTSLKNLNAELSQKQSDAPALATAYLMERIGIIGLKNTQTNLLRDKKEIQMFNYPFILTKMQKDADMYYACSFSSCFSSSKDLLHVRENIEKIFNP